MADAADEESREDLRELVARVLEQAEEEGSAALERACRERPDLAEALRARLEQLTRIGLGPLAAARPPTPTIPERLGDFRLLERLGAGGMGVVYRAEQESLKRVVALKIIRPEHLYFRGARARFRREVEAVARLNHPAIVPVFSVDDGDLPHFAMEFVEGASVDRVLSELRDVAPWLLDGRQFAAAIAQLLERGGQPAPHSPPDEVMRRSWIEVALHLLLDAADGIEHAHERGVLHRDLKPGNLMVTAGGRARVVDFGLASTSGASRITKSGAHVGSLPYTAPEVLRDGAEAADARTDVYGLGVTLYEMLSLRGAFIDANEARIRQRIQDGDFPPLATLNSAVPWDVETVCLTAMALEPERRYASAALLAADLRRLLAHEPIRARRSGWLLRGRRFAQRRPAVVTGIVLGLATLVGVPGAWAWQEHVKRRELGVMNAEIVRRLAAETEARRSEDVAKQKAQRNAARARAAVMDLLTEVGDTILKDTPNGEVLRRKLLDRAVELYEEILAEDDSREARVELASVLRRSALAHQRIGETDRARRVFERSREILEPLQEGATIDVAAEVTRAKTEGDLATTDLNAGRFEQALARLNDCVATFRRLAALQLPDDEQRSNLGVVLLNLSTAQRMTGDLRGAEQSLLDSIEQTESISAVHAAMLDAPESIAYARVNLGGVCWNAGRYDDAERAFAAGIAGLGALLESAPHDVERRRTRALARCEVGRLRVQRGEVEEAFEPFEQACEEMRELARDFPRRSDIRAVLAIALVSWAGALPADRDEEIGALIDEAEPLLEGIEVEVGGTSVPLVLTAAAGRRLAAGDVAGAVDRLRRARDRAEQVVRARDGDAENDAALVVALLAMRGPPPDALPAAERLAAAARAVEAAAHALAHSDRYGSERRERERALFREQLLAAFDWMHTLAPSPEASAAAATTLRAALPEDAAMETRLKRS